MFMRIPSFFKLGNRGRLCSAGGRVSPLCRTDGRRICELCKLETLCECARRRGAPG